MSNEIIRISNIARQHQKVDTVMYALNEENLKQSARKIAGNKAVGIDNVTKKEYVENLDSNIKELIENMKKMAYKPKAVRRVYIPKPGSEKKRPLGIKLQKIKGRIFFLKDKNKNLVLDFLYSIYVFCIKLPQYNLCGVKTKYE